MRFANKALMIASCVVLVLVSGCGDSAPNASTQANGPAITAFTPGKPLTAAFSDARAANMKGVAENDRLRLFVEEASGAIAVLNKHTGAIWHSNPPGRESDSLASGVNKDLLSSQMKVDFYNNLGQLSSINTYTDSAAYKQIRFEPIPGGVRASYQFGTAKKSFEDMPPLFSKARFEELSGKLNKTEQRALSIAYKEDIEKGIFVRNDAALQGVQLDRALKALESADYTEEDLLEDAAELNMDLSKPEPRIFRASIEYLLDDDSLVAKIPADSIYYPEEYPVNMISMLSFFGAGGADAEGSIFVPDGSGALIRFNNGKTKYPAYQQVVYGSDQTVDRTEDPSREQDVRLPVFGMVREGEAFLGIIEEGAAAATINADVAGRLNGYNYVYPSFYVINKDEVTLFANEQQRSLPKFQERPMMTDYAVRYAFLSGEEASVAGMAHYYQQYLLKRNGLPQSKANPEAKDVPFYLQLVGSISKQKHFAGIPYDSLESLTTFGQARDIVAQAQERGICNLKVKFAGWFNEGLDHEVPDSVSVDKAVGGSKGLQDFVAFARDRAIAFFPDVAFLVANTGDSFDESDDASRTLRDEPAMLFPVNLALNRRDRTKPPSYVVSPRLIGRYVDKMRESLREYKAGGISLRDMADTLNSDFRENKLIDRVQSQGISADALGKLRDDKLEIMGNGGNAYALPYLSDITEAPMSNSRFKLEDEEIPFYQMVVRGYIDYTGQPYNLSTYNDVRQYVLRSIEYGAGVYFDWIYEPNYKVNKTDYDRLFAVNYELWIDQAAEIYKEVNGVLGRVQGQRMISHEKLDEGVFRTVYENGTYVIVNYNRSPAQADGMTIEAESYVTGGEQP
ncbi:DUF5696 domain-containing protein [Cohnella panacarvi]|uniref:DUF5696 domain-containing protein n=1 Tax=Cohnella panacarvi TaxID=400776 RepID=UPI00047A7673|nr:DUF5696 domain-containing protein [Cohnella panacarvi]